MNRERLLNYFYLMRLHKPIGIFLLLWPTLWALWLAGVGKPNMFIVLIFVLGVIVMRSAGCVMNDIADRNFDLYVKRTRERPITSGKITITSALILCFFLCAIAFSLVLFLNRFTMLLSVFGLLFALLYPLLKRVTYLPQLGLGVAFSWGIPMAFAAENNHITLAGWFLFCAGVIWPVIYDTQYAMVDRADDEVIGVKSTAILFGKFDRLIIAILQILFLCLLVVVGILFDLHWPYYLALSIAAILFFYQQRLMGNHDPDKYFQAFLNNHWVGLVIFLGIFSSYLA